MFQELIFIPGYIKLQKLLRFQSWNLGVLLFATYRNRAELAFCNLCGLIMCINKMTIHKKNGMVQSLEKVIMLD